MTSRKAMTSIAKSINIARARKPKEARTGFSFSAVMSSITFFKEETIRIGRYDSDGNSASQNNTNNLYIAGYFLYT